MTRIKIWQTVKFNVTDANQDVILIKHMRLLQNGIFTQNVSFVVCQIIQIRIDQRGMSKHLLLRIETCNSVLQLVQVQYFVPRV